MDLPALIKRLADALNAHDPMQIAAAFTVDYHREVPAASRTCAPTYCAGLSTAT
jgi:hypothetical protein